MFPTTLASLLVTLILGGVGDGYPLVGAAVELIQLLMLAVLALNRPSSCKFGTLTRCGLALLVATIALTLLHLVPLPREMWPVTSGRRVPEGVWAAINAPLRNRPLTLDAGFTLDTMLELLPALAMFLAAARTDRRRQLALIALVVGVAGLSACLGVFQKSAGVAQLLTSGHATNGPGLFVNRNHQATMLLVAILLSPVTVPALAPALRGGSRITLTGALVLVFAGGVIATTSRAGLVLLLPAVAGAAALTSDLRLRPGPLLAGAAALALTIWTALRVASVQLVIARFTQLDERLLYWRDSWPAIRAFWPLGSGIGTFTRVFPMYERDTLVAGASINAAHNEYVQLLLEGGLPAAVLITTGIALLGWAVVRLTRIRESRMGWSAAAAIVVILLHSTVDYPLRMMSMMAVMGLLAAVLLTAVDRWQVVEGERR